jgi:hypothetical protein
MTIRKIASLALATMAAVAWLPNPAHADSVTYQVLVNTSGLAQGPDGLIIRPRTFQHRIAGSWSGSRRHSRRPSQEAS